MRFQKIKVGLWLLMGLLAAWSTPGARADVAIAKAGDGFVATTENYKAAIGADGNLHSLVAGGTEFLLDNYHGLVGGGYIDTHEGNPGGWKPDVFKYQTVEMTAPDTLTATAPNHSLIYKFLPDAIEMNFAHAADPAIYSFSINPAITDYVETESGETIPFRSPYREGTPQLFDKAGASITLPHGAFYFSGRNQPPFGVTERSADEPMLHQVWMYAAGMANPFLKRIQIHARPTATDALQASLSVPRANHIFPGGAPADIGLNAKMRFPNLAVNGQVEIAINDFLTKKEVYRKTQNLDLPAMSEKKATFPVTLPPGFYSALLTFKQGDETLAARTFNLAYDIDHLPLPPRPADFDKYWDDTLAEQEKIPANVKLTLERETPEFNSKLYRINFDGLMGRKFYGWLSLPNTPGKYAAHLTLPPSGINQAYLPSQAANTVGMSLAIAGQDVLPPEGGFKYWDYWRSGIEKRETWYYRAVFAACSRAIDILAARAEVDDKRIFVTGGSQGGGLAFITAALNPKVDMAVSTSPGLFGLEWKLRYLGPNWWPPIHLIDKDGQPIANPDSKELEALIAVARYGDAANFAPRIKCPILLGVGMQDLTTAPTAVLAAWSRITNAPIKAMLADPWAGHNGPRGGQGLGAQWNQALVANDVKRVLEMKEAPPVNLPVIIETKK